MTVRYMRSVVTLALIIFGFAALTRAATSPRVISAQQVARAVVAQRFIDAYNAGDVDTAAAMFADNAIYIGTLPGGSCSIATPCTDHAAIRQQLAGGVATHSCYTVTSLDVEGSNVVLQAEIRADVIRNDGIERIKVALFTTIVDDKLAKFLILYDLADPQTAQRAAITAGQQPRGVAVPAPATPCNG